MAVTIEDAVKIASTKFSYASLKDKQLVVVTVFVSGLDVFASLPTSLLATV